MKTFLKTFAVVALGALGFTGRPAEAQVSVGIATPGFSLGVGPGAGFVGVGGVYPGYPVYPAYPAVVGGYYGPRPFVPPPVYGRPFYGPGPGYGYGRPGYGYGPRPAPYPVRRYR